MGGKGAAELGSPRAEGGAGAGHLGASSGWRVGSAERVFFVAKGKNRRALPCDKRVWLHPFHWGLPAVSTGSVREGVQAPSKERVAPPPTGRERRLRPGHHRRAHLLPLRALRRPPRWPVPRAGPRRAAADLPGPCWLPASRGFGGRQEGRRDAHLPPRSSAHLSTMFRTKRVESIGGRDATGVPPFSLAF